MALVSLFARLISGFLVPEIRGPSGLLVSNVLCAAMFIPDRWNPLSECSWSSGNKALSHFPALRVGFGGFLLRLLGLTGCSTFTFGGNFLLRVLDCSDAGAADFGPDVDICHK